MRVAANLSWLFSEAGPSVVQRCAAARAAGFTVVESDWPGVNVSADQYRQALQDASLTAILINCFQGDTSAGECGFAAEPGQELQFMASLNSTVQYARTIGCSRIHLLSGRLLEGAVPGAQEAVMVSNLRTAVPLLQQYDMTALIEPINPVSKPGYFLNNYPTCVRVLEAVGSDRVRLQLDVFHLQMISGSAIDNIRGLLPFTGHVQVAQAPDRHEPSSAGCVDYEAVFSLLKEAGYTGYVGCEYKPSGKSADSLGWVTRYGLHF